MKKFIHLFFLTIFITSIFLSQPLSRQETVRAETLNLPSLSEFAARVREPAANNLAGLYADGLFAYPVVQQPQGNAAFVSNQSGVLTSFSLANQYQTTGLLAHNTMAGADFEYLRIGQSLTLIYASGEMESFQIVAVERYQALSPNSPYSEFIDQATADASRMSASELFNHIYAPKGRLILQTCIAANGLASWGRLFIIAIPKSRHIFSPLSFEPMAYWYKGYGIAAR